MLRSRRFRVVVAGVIVGGLLVVGSGEVPAEATASSASQSPAATVSGTPATVTWSAPASPGSHPAHRYEIVATLEDCSNGTLDGLLHIDGSGNTHKRAAWYAYAACGQLAGDLVEAGTTDPTMTATAAYDSTNDAVRMLIGRNQVYSPGRADADTVVRISTPVAFGSDVTISVQRIEDTGLTVTAPPLHAAVVCDTTVSSGVAEVTIPDFADNDAYLVTVEPDSGSHGAC